MKPFYSNFQQIEIQLKQLDLERKIAREELKLLKIGLKDDFQPFKWVEPIVRGASKYGVFMLIRKLFFRR